MPCGAAAQLSHASFGSASCGVSQRSIESWHEMAQSRETVKSGPCQPITIAHEKNKRSAGWVSDYSCMFLTLSHRLAAQSTNSLRSFFQRSAVCYRYRSLSAAYNMPKRKRTEQVVASLIAEESQTTIAISRPKRSKSVKKIQEEAWDYPDASTALDGNESPLTDLDEEKSPKKGKGTGKRRKKKKRRASGVRYPTRRT